jgi:polyhydroxyalkanoate synthesis repressor PhaR
LIYVIGTSPGLDKAQWSANPPQSSHGSSRAPGAAARAHKRVAAPRETAYFEAKFSPAPTAQLTGKTEKFMSEAATKTAEPVTIKKYANRRLYNTGTSAYVTLEDLAAMVKTGEDFVVYDAKTGEDITRSVLTQIIFEQENKEGQNLLPIAFLRQLIRFYGDSMQMLVPRYLEVSIESLTREQEKFRHQMAQAFGVGAFTSLEEQVRRNMEMFERAFAMFVPFARRDSTSEAGPDAEKGSGKSGDIDDLKRQLDEMKRKVDRLTGGGG